ncbi:hypothetical protein NUBL9661_17240 [Klebsiella pneumoniae]|nr:hypothetical protein NUBL9661_17240 [Klebsiella pneumoniae]
MSIATYLNTGLAILGWAYIMVKTGQWITKNALRQWDKRRKESRRQKAVNEFYDAFVTAWNLALPFAWPLKAT